MIMMYAVSFCFNFFSPRLFPTSLGTPSGNFFFFSRAPFLQASECGPSAGDHRALITEPTPCLTTEPAHPKREASGGDSAKSARTSLRRGASPSRFAVPEMGRDSSLDPDHRPTKAATHAARCHVARARARARANGWRWPLVSHLSRSCNLVRGHFFSGSGMLLWHFALPRRQCRTSGSQRRRAGCASCRDGCSRPRPWASRAWGSRPRTTGRAEPETARGYTARHRQRPGCSRGDGPFAARPSADFTGRLARDAAPRTRQPGLHVPVTATPTTWPLAERHASRA